MRIGSIDRAPIHEIFYQAAAPGGGVETCRLPILRGRVDALPDGLDAVIAASDLQGVAPSRVASGAVDLLGEALAEALVELADAGALPAPERTGIILAGDLYVHHNLDRRGGAGDVRSVWLTFAEQFAWVAGVAGNHDEFGYTPREVERFRKIPRVHLLDGNVATLGGLRVGGVGGIIGNSNKPGRRPAQAYLDALATVLAASPDVVVLHEGPDVPGTANKGTTVIREALAARASALVVCGHKHWATPLGELPGGAQVLNVDGRAVLLARG